MTKKTSPRSDWEGRLGETGRAPPGAQKGARRRGSTVSGAEQKPSTTRRPVSMAGDRRERGGGGAERLKTDFLTHAGCGGRKWRGSWRRMQGPAGFSKIRASLVGSSPARKSLGRRQAPSRPQARRGCWTRSGEEGASPRRRAESWPAVLAQLCGRDAGGADTAPGQGPAAAGGTKRAIAHSCHSPEQGPEYVCCFHLFMSS